MSMTVLNSHEEKDMNMGSHIDSDAVEAVGGGGSSVDVQAIVSLSSPTLHPQQEVTTAKYADAHG